MLLKILTSVWFTLALALIALIIGIMIIVESTKILLLNKMYRQKNRGVAYACDFINIVSPRAEVFRRAVLMPENVNGNGVCDIVRISSGGILLFTVVSDKGKFFNPKTGDWRYTYTNIMHDEVTISRPNPFDKMVAMSNVIERVLANEEIFNKTITRVVLFTSNSVEYELDYNEVLTLDTVEDFITDFDMMEDLVGDEIRATKKAIARLIAKNEAFPEGEAQKMSKARLRAKRDVENK